MKQTGNLVVPLAASITLGLANSFLLLLFFSQWSLYNPLLAMLISPDHVAPYYQWVLYPTDFLAAVLVSLPLAALIVWFRPARPWLYTACAVVAGIAYWHWQVVLPSFEGPWWPLLYDMAILPAAVLAALFIQRRFCT